MPFVPLKLIPNANVEFTETLNQAGISDCNLIRYKSGLPQKLGGWEKYYPFAISGGIARDLHAWQDLTGNDWLAYAATSNVSVISDGAATTITPQTLTSDNSISFDTTSGSAIVTIDDNNISNVTDYDSILFMTPIAVGGLILQGIHRITANVTATSFQITASSNATANVTNGGAVPQFTTTNGSTIVTVTFAGHGLSVDDDFTFLVSTTGGGVTVFGTYPVLTVPTGNTFTIAVNDLATSSVSFNMNSNQQQLLYFIALGPPGLGSGYGTGTYGTGGYGTGTTGTAQEGDALTVTDYTLDNWGEIFLACAENAQIFEWQPNSGFQNMRLIDGAPPFNTGIFVAMPAQILVAYGSSTSSLQQDPLLIRWSDQENYYTWVANSENQAGSFRIPTGSKIVGALQGPQQALIWTDIDVWAMVYQGQPYVFGFNKISSGCGLIGHHAAAQMRGVVYWMNQGNFFFMGGEGVGVLPCTVWDFVFQDLDTDNQSKCIAAANSSFDEIWFFFPSLSGGTGECDKYVKYNVVEKGWDFGTMGRSAWIDQSVLGQPVACTSGGIIYQHEVSENAAGAAMNWWVETGYFTLSDGQDIMTVDWLIPDFRFGYYNGSQSATIYITLTAVDYPNGTERSYGPFTVTEAKQYVNCRLRGRQIKIRFEGNDLDSFVRLGLTKVRMAPDGRN